jgi:hypothetical protein
VDQEVDVAMSVAVHRAGETRAEADLTVPAPRPYRMPVLFLGGGGSRAACAGEAEATARSAQSHGAAVADEFAAVAVLLEDGDSSSGVL